MPRKKVSLLARRPWYPGPQVLNRCGISWQNLPICRFLVSFSSHDPLLPRHPEERTLSAPGCQRLADSSHDSLLHSHHRGRDPECLWLSEARRKHQSCPRLDCDVILSFPPTGYLKSTLKWGRCWFREACVYQPRETPGPTPFAGHRFRMTLGTGFKNALQLPQWLAVLCVSHPPTPHPFLSTSLGKKSCFRIDK